MCTHAHSYQYDVQASHMLQLWPETNHNFISEC